jgi:hypothetical protein
VVINRRAALLLLPESKGHKLNRFARGLNAYSKTALYFQPASLLNENEEENFNTALFEPETNRIILPFLDCVGLKIGTSILHETVHARFENDFKEGRDHILQGYSELKPKTYLAAKKNYATGFGFDELATFSYEARFLISKLGLILEDKEDPALWDTYLIEALWITEVGERLARELGSLAKTASKRVEDLRHVSVYKEGQYGKIWAKISVDLSSKLFVPLTIPGLDRLSQVSNMKDETKEALKLRFQQMEAFCAELKRLLAEVNVELKKLEAGEAFSERLHQKVSEIARWIQSGRQVAPTLQ